jgi:iron complex transport system ATP-binding protein
MTAAATAVLDRPPVPSPLDRPGLLAARGLPPSAAPLRADGLVLRLGGRPVVDGVSITLQAGQWLALVGPNGAGKSSLLALLAGLKPADAGTIHLAGRPLADWSSRQRAQHIAWLAQQGEAEGEIAVADVVRLGRLPHQGLWGAATAADEAIVQAAMAETACAELADRRLSALSGGERQRALLARALAVQAPVLLLDEPTSHLDAPHQRALIRSLMQRAREGAAVAAVLHDLNLALAADRLLVMAEGRLVADGAPGDTRLQQRLVEVFDHAFTIQPLGDGTQRRWVAVPAL